MNDEALKAALVIQQAFPPKDGEPGKDGAEGTPGPKGPTGKAGAIGPKGDQGPKGDPGKDGKPGPTGEQGPEGQRGKPGPRGPMGPQGNAVSTGGSTVRAYGSNITDFTFPGATVSITGTSASITTTGGSSGVSALTANSSNSTTGIVNLKAGTNVSLAVAGQDITIGTIQSTGPQGPQGPAGSNGAQGAQGIPGPVGLYVADITSSSSNSFTGQVDIRALGATLAITSNTITIEAAAAAHTHGPQTSALLSTIHTDTVPATVQRGDIVAASSNATWKRMGTPQDAFSSDRFLGTINGDPTWRPRFYGVDGIAPGSISSNFLTGGVAFTGNGTIALSVASNTIALTALPPSSIAAASNARLDINPGFPLKLPVSGVAPSTASEGDTWFDPNLDVLMLHDGVRASPASPVGFMPYAYVAGVTPDDQFTTGVANLPAAGGSVAAPIYLFAPLILQNYQIRSNDTTLTRTWECALYYENNDTTNTLVRIGGTYARETFVAAAASIRTANVDSPGIVIPAGVVWAVVRNIHSANSFTIGGLNVLTPTGNLGQTATIAGSQLAALTLNFVVGWTRSTTILPVIRLGGRTFGTPTVY